VGSSPTRPTTCDPWFCPVDDRTQKIIDALAACAASCAACSKDCASRGDSRFAACIALCNDCAVLCGARIPLIASGSQFSAELCRVCADACEQCADECDRRGMTACADACRKAAQVCREMAGAAA